MVNKQTVAQVRDPVCGMIIEPQDAVSRQEYPAGPEPSRQCRCFSHLSVGPRSGSFAKTSQKRSGLLIRLSPELLQRIGVQQQLKGSDFS